MSVPTVFRAAFATAFLMIASFCGAQVGLPADSTFSSTGIDQIKLGYLNLHIPILVHARNSRGKLFEHRFVYDLPQWTTQAYGPTYLTGGFWRELIGGEAGVLLAQTSQYGGLQLIGYQQLCPNYDTSHQYMWEYDDATYEDVDGTTHSFHLNYAITTEDFSCNGKTSGYTSTDLVRSEDASGVQLRVTHTDDEWGYGLIQVIDAGGNVIGLGNDAPQDADGVLDRNGNATLYTPTIQDATGTSPITRNSPNCASASFCGAYTYPAEGGATAYTYTTQWDTHDLNVPCDTSGTTRRIGLLKAILLADGTQYSFRYDDYGRMTHMGTPSGASYDYTYPQSYACYPNQYGGETSIGPILHMTRTINSISQWSYDTTLDTNSNPRYNSSNTTVVQEPDGQSITYRVADDGTEFSRAGRGKVVKTCYLDLSQEAPHFCETPDFQENNPYFRSVQTVNVEDGSSFNSIEYRDGMGQIYSQRFYDYGNTDISLPDRRVENDFDYSANPVLATEVKLYDHEVLLSDTKYSYDESPLTPSGSPNLYKTGNPRRGNQTAVARWVSGSNWETEHKTYYDNGLVHTATDARGNTTTYTYDACGHSFLTRTDAPLGMVTEAGWDCSSNEATSVKDVNGTVTTMAHADPEYRITSRATPSTGAMAQYAYDDTVRSVEVRTRKDTASAATPDAGWLDDIAVHDELDRPSRAFHFVGNGQWLTVDKNFDTSGRVSFVSNPYLSSGTNSGKRTSGAGVQSSYDNFGRVQAIQMDSASSKTFSYSGRDYEETDEASHSRMYRTDAFSNIVKVCEITGAPAGSDCGLGISGAGLVTSYSYNANNALLSVNQVGVSSDAARQRSFTYDARGRILTAFNPEAGTICYGLWSGSTCTGGYDANGNVLTKTDGRKVVTANTYDALNRLTSNSFSGPDRNQYYGDTACYGYDDASVPNAVGRLTAEWTQRGACAASVPVQALTRKLIGSYDAMGRVVSQKICAQQNCTVTRPQSYTYDLAGNLKTYTDGAGGQTFTQGYDSAGRLSSLSTNMTDASHPATLFNVKTFDPFGWATASYGTGMGATRGFDVRGRVSGFEVKAGQQ